MKIFRDLDEYENIQICIKQLNSLFDSYTTKPIITFGKDDDVWLDISYNNSEFTVEENAKEIYHICDVIHAFLDGYKFFKSNVKKAH